MNGTRWAGPRPPDEDFKAELLKDLAVVGSGISTWSGPAGNAARAIASAKDRRQIEPVCLLEIPEDLLADLNIRVSHTPGITLDAGLVDSHRTIECEGARTLFRLVDGLSLNPSTRSFGKAEVGQLLRTSIDEGLDIGRLHHRRIDDLMSNGILSMPEGREPLEALFNRNPCAVRDLKAERVVALVQARVITEDKAMEHHPGFLTALQKFNSSATR